MESKNNKQKPSPSPTNLFSSAQVVAEAAKSTLRHDTDKVDKGKAAGAAADILHAASHYGKLEEKTFGKYIQKAEDYLHRYESSHSTSTAGPTNNTKPTKPTEHSSGEHTSSKPHSSSQHEPSAAHDSDKKKKNKKEEEPEGGFGDYIKMAQGFLGKQGGAQSGGNHSGGGSGVGDYVKLAQGFLKKH
ncbi:hypothetical protein LUZ62_077833 [Rhynchospora pubera]|uniref:Nodulin-related protein 1 n=1 Tax=Rhynchospora pubera TaxID=906938 RepID=A0AAV8DE28_9POAL|nr:hypothetical protein LUZ62_077833 [Rhynchospora pubera]